MDGFGKGVRLGRPGADAGDKVMEKFNGGLGYGRAWAGSGKSLEKATESRNEDVDDGGLWALSGGARARLGLGSAVHAGRAVRTRGEGIAGGEGGTDWACRGGREACAGRRGGGAATGRSGGRLRRTRGSNSTRFAGVTSVTLAGHEVMCSRRWVSPRRAVAGQGPFPFRIRGRSPPRPGCYIAFPFSLPLPIPPPPLSSAFAGCFLLPSSASAPRRQRTSLSFLFFPLLFPPAHIVNPCSPCSCPSLKDPTLLTIGPHL